jgi:RNA polymerase-binding transcription factor DksA
MAKKKPASKAVRPVKKAAAKKPVKKVAAKKAAPKKPAAKKKPVAKAVKPVKKTAAKRAVKNPVAKKAAPKKAAAKKVATTKAVKKTTVKPVAKKAMAKKVAKAPAKKAASKAVKKAAPAKVPAKPSKTPAPAKAAPKNVKTATPAPKAAPKKPAAAKKKRTKAAPEPKAPARPLVTQGVGPSMPRVTPMVKKQVSTLEAGNKARYSDSDLEEFREIIMAKLDEARKDYDLLKQTLANTDNNGTEDTSPSFKMIEDGSETLGREETAHLAGRQEKYIKNLEDALLRIRNKTYGICRITGKLISKERLRLVPHATLSIEAKQQMSN